MATIIQRNLFSWEEIFSSSDLDRLRLVIETISLVDEPLMTALEKDRANGQNKYPVRQTWHAVLAGIVFQHSSIESLRRELRRNAELRNVCGFDVFRGERAVPSKDGFSHFLSSLMKHEAELTDIFHRLIELIREYLPNLGEKIAAVRDTRCASSSPTRL